MEETPLYTKHDLQLEIRMATMEQDIKGMRKDIEELRDLLKSDMKDLRGRVNALEKSKTWTLGWVAGVTVAVTVAAEVLRRVMGW